MATGLHREFSFGTLMRYRVAIEALLAEHPSAAFASFVALYTIAIALSIPGSAILTVTGGFLFGPLIGGLGAFIGANTGAALIFLIARTAFGGWLVKWASPRAVKLADGFCRNAFWYLLFLRLVPFFPFWLVNIAPALFGVRFATFLAATAIGIVPLTLAFALFGAGLDSAFAAQASAYEACLAAGHEHCRIEFDLRAAFTPELIVALALLSIAALIPVAAKRWRTARERDTV